MSATKRARTSRAKSVSVKLVRLPHADGLPLPTYQTALSAGMDLHAAIPLRRPTVLAPGARALIPTGLILEIPKGFEGQVRSRSGLAYKHGITVLNSPGTIDSDYRGEVSVILVNLGDKPFKIRREERIAQLIIAPVTQAKLNEVRIATTTKRGKGGFGSTGVKSRAKSPKPTRAKTAPKRK